MTIFGRKIGKVWNDDGRYWLMLYTQPLVVQLTDGSHVHWKPKPHRRLLPLSRRGPR